MPELHPKGVFNDVKILDSSWDKSPEKGTPYLWVSYETEHGVLVGRHYITEKTFDRFAEMLMAIGYTGDEPFSDLGLSDGTALRGMVCQITVEHEEYDGVTRARVAWVNANNSTGSASRNTTTDLGLAEDRFNMLFRKATGQSKKKETAKAPW